MFPTLSLAAPVTRAKIKSAALRASPFGLRVTLQPQFNKFIIKFILYFNEILLDLLLNQVFLQRFIADNNSLHTGITFAEFVGYFVQVLARKLCQICNHANSSCSVSAGVILFAVGVYFSTPKVQNLREETWPTEGKKLSVRRRIGWSRRSTSTSGSTLSDMSQTAPIPPRTAV